VVTGPCGTTTSTPAALVVGDGPAIASHPESAAVCLGGEAALSVLVNGSGVEYTWRKDGEVIAGASGSSLVITGIAEADAGSYDVVISSACGSATSAAAVLEVRAGPVIDGVSAGGAYCPDESVVLEVAAQGHDLRFQWLRDGAELPGEEGAALVLEPFQPSDAGSYSVVVTNDCGSAQSAAAAVLLSDDCGAMFIRGDGNGDGHVDISDVISGLNFLFRGLGTPGCLETVDANDDGGTDIADPIYLLGWLFRGGAAPPEPGGAGCGADPTADDLTCASYACP
jgi:hypothetical protein